MIFPNIHQIAQLMAWFLAIGELILAGYFLATNIRHRLNRLVAASLFVFALHSFSYSNPITSTRFSFILPILFAITTPVIAPLSMHAFIAILKPGWLQKKNAWVNILFFTLTGLPILFTILDVLLGTGLWYTSLPKDSLISGVGFTAYTKGSLVSIIRLVNLYIVSFMSLLTSLYIVIKAKTKDEKQLGWMYFSAIGLLIISEIILRTSSLSEVLPGILPNLAIASGITIAAAKKIRLEKIPARGKIRPRILSLVLGTVFLVFASIILIMAVQTNEVVSETSINQLRKINQSLSLNTYAWLENSRKALEEIVAHPAIVSMDPEQQKELLEIAANVHTDWYLVSTTDTQGINIARSDDVAPKDYSDRDWVKSALAGNYLTYQTLIGRTSGEPALVLSMPIRNEANEIIGVGMFASDLSEITKQINATTIGETGYAFVVDNNGQVLAHPEKAFTGELRDLSNYPPVLNTQNWSRGNRGRVGFEDEEGVKWTAYIDVLPNSWGIIVQQTEAEAFSNARELASLGVVPFVLGFVLIALSLTLVISQALQPVLSLTDTATAIAEGDLEQKADILSSDEIGQLAQIFNNMTSRLRETINSLEEQVNKRTQSLEQRSRQLQAAAEVSQAASAILDTQQLIQEVVELIKENFNLYYVGLFLVDNDFEWAVLQAGTGQAGQAMLARGHRIRVGTGMVGWCINHSQSRVAQLAGDDAVRLATEELPETRSEAAIPLRARGEVIGALTVQSTQVKAFDEVTVATLQTMADQVAIALSNVRLFAESQEALTAAQRAYRDTSHQAWQELVQREQSTRGFRSTSQSSISTTESIPPHLTQALKKGNIVSWKEKSRHTLLLPILTRDTVIGIINTHKPATEKAWTKEEINVLETVAEQIGVALESARLYQETQRRAAREQALSEMSASFSRSLDIDAVLQTAAQELGELLQIEEVSVYAGSPEETVKPTEPSNERENMRKS